jgi:hypothetical protein
MTPQSRPVLNSSEVILLTVFHVFCSVEGACHCGNIRWEMQLSRSPSMYNPRTCDCDFCRKHGAAYVSDPNGTLRVWIKAERDSRIYRQGTRMAEFLICGICGILLAVLYPTQGCRYAAVNSNLAGATAFGPEKSGSPERLSEADRVKRWQELWFSNVALNCEAP